MRKMTSDEIRDMWLEFFKSKGHYVEPSANLIPVNDPTLLWINAGVAALKKYFDGSERPEHRRITNAQKCIRTNDIENVGHTARHHTFFEMLGNFSIGDYFRNEVIPWACELLMGEKWFSFPSEKLYVTYYPDDMATKELWIKHGIMESHMIPMASNFWEIGEGPGGPDTEIFFDRGESWDKDHKGIELLQKDEENDRFIEIWNIVFSQYNCNPSIPRSQYKELPQKNIDTGAGLERIACVMQGAETNFDTDLFKPTIDAIKASSIYPYEGDYKLAYRVIADHIRSVTFALADGAGFSNEGRGYVLRRLVRRAVRYANKLGLEEGFLSKLVFVCCKTMSHYYPYLLNEQEKVSKMVLAEEQRFSKTLKQGESLLEGYLDNTADTLSGEDAFRLSDTYGFPIELTVEISQEKGKKVDIEGFKKELQAQKERARQARGDRESFKSQSKDLLAFTLPSDFTYDVVKNMKAKVIGLFKNGVQVKSIDDEGDIILDHTDFYAESGGQVADHGTIENDSCRMDVDDVQKAPNKQFLHHVKVLYGTCSAGDEFILEPDYARRDIIRKNHSSCHLLQSALQKYLGEDVHQAGSYVDDGVMRFDFTFERKLTEEELNEIEKQVNLDIQLGVDCVTKIMDKKEAEKTGAMHLFSEKYGDKVRVVSFEGISKEFCAGTHVNNTRDIGVFVIASEEAIAAGVRRITAYTGLKGYEFLSEKQGELMDVAGLLGVKSDKEVPVKLKAMLAEEEGLKKRIAVLEESIVSAKVSQILSLKEEVKGFDVYKSVVKGFNHVQLQSLLKEVCAKDPKAIIVLFDVDEGKGQMAVGLGNESLKAYKAGLIIRELAKRIGGSGGGKPDMAFGGFNDVSKAEEGLKAVGEIL